MLFLFAAQAVNSLFSARESVLPNCPVCDTQTDKIVNCGSTALLQCAVCLHHWNFILDDDSKKYQDNYHLTHETLQSEEHQEVLASNRRRWSRLPEQLRLLMDIKKHHPTATSILDVGCDRGYFLTEARHFKYNVTGIEPSRFAQSYLQLAGIPYFSSLDEFDGKVDCVTFWHSLEHMNNPKQVLKTVYSKLNDKGLVLIRVPDFSSFPSMVLGKRWGWFQPEFHVMHFSRESLVTLVEAAGFETVFVKSQRPNKFLDGLATWAASLNFRFVSGEKRSLKSKLSFLANVLMSVEIYIVIRKK